MWVYLSPTTASLIQPGTLHNYEILAEIRQHCNLKSFGSRQIVCTCLISFLQVIARYTNSRFLVIIALYIYFSVSFLNVFVITICHITVYFVFRRHMKQIKSELVSLEDTVKFLKERKALKPTTIIIIF